MKFETILNALKINPIATLTANLKHFGMTGLFKMPILIQYGSRLNANRGAIIIQQPLKFNMLRLKTRNNINVEREGRIILTGDNTCFNYMNVVNVFKGATLEIGANFCANGLAEINCKKSIKFGSDCLISVHTMFMDTDFHHIYDGSRKINNDKGIIIGNRVWIGCNTTILKGTEIGNDIVIGAGSLLSGRYIEDGSIYAARTPVNVIRSGINWKQ